MTQIGKQQFISLVVDKDFVPSRNKGKLYKAMAGLGELMGLQELNLSTSQLKVDTDKLL